MKHSLHRWALAAGLALIGATGAHANSPPSERPAPVDLTATWTDSAHVDLRWQNRATDAVGVFVEYGNPGIPDFIVLTIGRPAMTAFRHRNVAPETTFLYRIRPYFGPASAVVSIVTGRATSGGMEREGDGPLASSGASAVGAAQQSLRHAPSAAAPAELTVKPGLAPTTVELRWQDRAADEDGYLVEMVQGPGQDFKISALLPPDATSYRMTGLAGETAHAFRVRAFFRGEASNVAQVTTPPRPP